MIRFEYSLINYEDLIKHYAREFHTKVKNNSIVLPPEIGSGTMRAILLSNGLQIFVRNYTLKQDLLHNRKQSKKDFYLLRFEEITQPSSSEPNSKSAVFLSATNHNHLFLHPAGTHVKAVSVLFSKTWLEKFLSFDICGDAIKKYLSSSSNPFSYEPMDAEYRRLMNEMLHLNTEEYLEPLIFQNRMMLMIEKVFTRFYLKITDSNYNLKISDEEMTRLKKVEEELLNDFSVPPPNILQLSRVAAMSPSKLTNSFKEIFGLPVYQYFQKNRMNKAKAMLLSKKYSVKEVSMELGFSSAANFAKAFQKSFDQMPGEVAVMS